MATRQFNDSFVANTADLTAPGAPCFNDCEQNYYTYVIDNNAPLAEYGYTAVTDKERKHLQVAAAGLGVVTTGTTNDLWVRVLKASGITGGSINDLKAKYFIT